MIVLDFTRILEIIAYLGMAGILAGVVYYVYGTVMSGRRGKIKIWYHPSREVLNVVPSEALIMSDMALAAQRLAPQGGWIYVLQLNDNQVSLTDVSESRLLVPSAVSWKFNSSNV